MNRLLSFLLSLLIPRSVAHAATTAITPTALALNTASASLPDSSGTAATTPSDGFVIAMAAGDLGGKGTPESLLIKMVADSDGDTVTFAAGDNPPAMRKGLGSLAVVLTASQVKYVVLEGSRFLQDDGTILATCTDTGTKLAAFGMPRESGRGGG